MFETKAKLRRQKEQLEERVDYLECDIKEYRKRLERTDTVLKDTIEDYEFKIKRKDEVHSRDFDVAVEKQKDEYEKASNEYREKVLELEKTSKDILLDAEREAKEIKKDASIERENIINSANSEANTIEQKAHQTANTILLENINKVNGIWELAIQRILTVATTMGEKYPQIVEELSSLRASTVPEFLENASKLPTAKHTVVKVEKTETPKTTK